MAISQSLVHDRLFETRKLGSTGAGPSSPCNLQYPAGHDADVVLSSKLVACRVKHEQPDHIEIHKGWRRSCDCTRAVAPGHLHIFYPRWLNTRDVAPSVSAIWWSIKQCRQGSQGPKSKAGRKKCDTSPARGLVKCGSARPSTPNCKAPVAPAFPV